MDITLHVYLHGSSEQQTRIERALNHLLLQGSKMTQLVDDVVAEVAALKTAFAPLPGAINALEAAITSLKDPADVAKLTQVLADLKGIQTDVTAAATDAADGVDEAVPPAP